MKSYLADVNVWVAIAHEAHLHHERARELVSSLGSQPGMVLPVYSDGICLRLLTNHKVMGDRARTQRGAWEIVDQFISG